MGQKNGQTERNIQLYFFFRGIVIACSKQGLLSAVVRMRKRAQLVITTKDETFPLLTQKHPSNWWMPKHNFIPSRTIQLQNYQPHLHCDFWSWGANEFCKSKMEKKINSFDLLIEGKLSEHISHSSTWELPQYNQLSTADQGAAPQEHMGSWAFLRTLWWRILVFHFPHSGFPSWVRGSNCFSNLKAASSSFVRMRLRKKKQKRKSQRFRERE